MNYTKKQDQMIIRQSSVHDKMNCLKIIKAFWAIFLIFFFCRYPNEPKNQSLLNTTWTLKSINYEGTTIKPQEKKVFIVQFKEDSIVVGSNDCNDFYAKYITPGDQLLKIYEINTTKIGCGGDQSISNMYLSALDEAYSYIIFRNCLYIHWRNKSSLIFISF